MNREVAILRDVITKITPMLAGMGLRVTQRGAQAYVVYKKDGCGMVDYVNIPHVPDNAEPSLVLAIQGFIDHEVGHILFTNVKTLLACKEKGVELAKKRGWPKEKGILYLNQLDNIVEDPYVEREMIKRFPGSLWNLDRLYSVFLEKTIVPALESVARTGGPKQAENEMGILMVPVIRAWAGQKLFQEFLDNTGGWDHPLLKAFTDRVPAKLRERIATAKNSRAVLEIAEELFEILYPVPPPPPPSPTPPSDEKSDEPKKSDDGKGEEGKSDKPKSKSEPKKEEGEIGKDEGEDAAADDKQESYDGEKKADDEGDDASDFAKSSGKDDISEGDKDDELGEALEEDASKDAGEGDEENEADEPGKGDEKPGTDAGSKGDPSDAGKTDAKDGSGDDEESATDGELSGENPSGEGEPIEVGIGKETEIERSPFEKIEIDLKDKDLSKAIAAIITEAATKETVDAPWLVYSTEYDKIEPLKVLEGRYEPAWLATLDKQTRHMIAPMQKDIERMMAARSQIIKVPGFRSGKLHGGSLHKLKTGDDRVFRRVQEGISKETAVTLLIDNSGSMNGSAIQVAMAAGYAMSQTLERVGIKHEVIGFTTCDYDGDRRALWDYEKKLHDEQVRIGRKFSRTEPLFMPIYKGFDERLTPTAKARFAYVFGGSSFLLQNIDGECLGIAGDRIARRREPRKVIIVLSDGEPASMTSDCRQLKADLSRRIKDLAARKIETIGIGIEDDSVKHFYPKYVVLKNLNLLPGTVMSELRRILLSK